MSQGKPINSTSESDPHPVGPPVSGRIRADPSDTSQLHNRPRLPLTAWVPPSLPVVIDPCGFWSAALVERMRTAGKPVPSFCLTPEKVDPARTDSASPNMQGSSVSDSTNNGKQQVKV